MKQEEKKLAAILTYSGTIPLILAALVPLFFIVDEADVNRITTTYSAIIISFLCGIHWAVFLFFSEKCPRNLFFTSNIVALIGWLSLIAAPLNVAQTLQILCFLYILVLDLMIIPVGVIIGLTR
ncbi:MAG: DUF3429 domain-containing protein [Holosporales bacterium]